MLCGVAVALLCVFVAAGADAACPNNGPNLIGPNNVQVPYGNVVLDWDSVPEASQYQVWVSIDLGQPHDQIVNAPQTELPINVEPGHAVQWRVIALAPPCAPMSSPQIFNFTTSCPTAKPGIQTPTRGQTFPSGASVTFSWTAVPFATGYDVQVTPDYGQSYQTVVANTAATSFTAKLDDGDWGWTVRVHYTGNCAEGFAEPSFFIVGSGSGGNCPANPGKPALIAPAANATGLASPVTFSWSAVPGAVGYRLLGAINGGPTETLAVGTDTKATVSLPAGSGFWLVQAYFGDDDCPTTFSERRAFTIAQGTACNTTPPTPLVPANNSVPNAQRVTFQWSAATGATGYELWVATGGSKDFSLYGTTEAKTTQLERFVPNDIVDWYVVARLSGCPSVRSATSRFGTAGGCNLAPVTLASPANAAEVSSPVTLSWNAVAGASEYRITIRSGDSTITTRSSTPSTSVRLPAGTFAWRVEALSGATCRSESPERTFVVKTAASCLNAAPTLISPTGSQAQPVRVTPPVNLRWSTTPNAIAFRVWLSRNGQPFEDVALTTATQLQLDLDEGGSYAWYVHAIFEGCDPKRSATGYFELAGTAGCSNGAPAILAPAAGASVNGRVTFQWSAVPGAVKYRVLVVVDGELRLLGTTSDTALERFLEPGTYTYSVEAVFENCRSTFAPRTTFTVAKSQNCSGEAPALVSPAANATVSDPEVTFVWTPVSGAIRYAVLAQVEDGAETLLGTTDASTLTHRIAPGKITWRVIAFFAGCEAEASPRATFTVQRPQGSCSDRKPLLLFPKNDGVVPSPVQLTWLGVPNAIEYRVWLQRGDERPSVIATTKETFAELELPAATYVWSVEARFASCPSNFSARGEFTAGAAVACGTPRRPDAQVVGRALSGTTYNVRWEPVPRAARYEVQESTTADFANAQTFLTYTPFRAFSHTVSGAPVQYFYRVRALSSCNDAPGPFSDVVDVYVVSAQTNSATAELGGTAEVVVQKIFVPGGTTPVQFTARTDKPWLMVTPTSGTLPPSGITLTVTANPIALKLGTNTGTVQLAYSNAVRNGVGTNDGPSQSNFPMSVSLVTPVMPEGKGAPPPDALIFPAVGHAAGANDSLFETDVRLTNLGAQTTKYDLWFTPSGTLGTESSATTTIEVSPNETVALDDIVANVFGDGTVGSAIGMLEVRPLGTSQSSGAFFGAVIDSAMRQLQTAASSRTYNFTPNGTFGQFVPAIPFAQFVGRGSVLSLTQVAQSNRFRANFGFLEASGSPADMIVRVYDTANTLLASIPVSLRGMEHRQLNGLLAQNGITTLDDGRVEVEVTGGDGKVSAYVSEIDNATNDPLMVAPVVKGRTRANRYVIPGMAYLRSGSAFWNTDLRIFNADAKSTTARLTFHPMGNPTASIARDITLDAGEIEVLNNVLVTLFGVTGDAGGSIVVTTPEETSLTVTARTFNQTSNGTYGQYLAGVTVEDAVGLGDRALQILQVEQSSRFRTNIGLTETSGKPVTVEVTLVAPDSIATAVVTIPLAANEFRQMGLNEFALPDAIYNGRVTVKVVEGEGRVMANGSAIDSITQDPTYIPAQ
ncbi:MAG TPA: hypothetical protein VND45_08060 [Thermoanaerobaculia bacterium]|nr:hypothetical protein [Thermoanaerobaculia bacterium]